MANLSNIVKISLANYNTLINGGTVSGYTYDPNAVYMVETDLDVSKVPQATPPTTDGTYVLKATVSSGVVTYSWIEEV